MMINRILLCALLMLPSMLKAELEEVTITPESRDRIAGVRIERIDSTVYGPAYGVLVVFDAKKLPTPPNVRITIWDDARPLAAFTPAIADSGDLPEVLKPHVQKNPCYYFEVRAAALHKSAIFFTHNRKGYVIPLREWAIAGKIELKLLETQPPELSQEILNPPPEPPAPR